MTNKDKNFYHAIVVGAGHAGAEAALALAGRGFSTLLLTLSLNAISFMACNPNIGGTAKGHLVREVDALGGMMGRVADAATIQTRMLNLGNGAAVHSLRNQVDKDKYHRLMKRQLEQAENLTVREGEVVDILLDGRRIVGVTTALGEKLFTDALVLCTGVYLNSKIIIGQYQKNAGPQGYLSAEGLTNTLIRMGLPVRRFKTGTPPRVLGASIDIEKMTVQEGDDDLYPFSEMTDTAVVNTAKCYLTYTNSDTHRIILENLERSPLFNGAIAGTGPRYCPSIEDKVVRFSDKDRHQIFVEPEGEDTDEMYVQGLSTSMPFDIQDKILRTVAGLENAKIMRYGYAIEYDCLDPVALLPTLAVKGYTGLYAAGQINGSSGYEEAAAQGLIAGVNAGQYLKKSEPLILGRDEAYIGVLIDDLVTKGTQEPYRMMTSRAEYRLSLRQDNADMRLTEKGYHLGLVTEERYQRFLQKCVEKEGLKTALKRRYSPKECEAVFAKKGEPLPAAGISAEDILRRSTLTLADLIEIDGNFQASDRFLLRQLETEIKYEGYLKKQERDVREMKKLEKKSLPPDLDYGTVEGLRIEAKQKLNAVKPLSLAQAARISGVNPADILVLMIFLEKRGNA